MSQLKLSFESAKPELLSADYQTKLREILRSDLDFHGKNSQYATHGWHSFPAKFPPQLPRKFILELTEPGDVVLDPMMGSGTTLLKAAMLDRKVYGFDIDPLSILIAKSKMIRIDRTEGQKAGHLVLKNAWHSFEKKRHDLEEELEKRFDNKTRNFINYWYPGTSQLELVALIREIERIENEHIRNFLKTVFSASIITKSGGVSLARDLAHTRPHRVKNKTINSAFEEFNKRLQRNLRAWSDHGNLNYEIDFADACALPLQENSVDLCITSPPYASNAIDYMRAHKFSLVWFGYGLDQLSSLRKRYLGGESLTDFAFQQLPGYPTRIIEKIALLDQKKAKVLHRYYSEMKRVLAEIYRVLKANRATVIVVGSSQMRGVDTETHVCLGEIGKEIGFELLDIGVRNLDRNKRMLPVGWKKNDDSKIEARMHREYVIVFVKPGL